MRAPESDPIIAARRERHGGHAAVKLGQPVSVLAELLQELAVQEIGHARGGRPGDELPRAAAVAEVVSRVGAFAGAAGGVRFRLFGP